MDSRDTERLRGLLSALFKSRQMAVDKDVILLWIRSFSGMTVDDVERGIIGYMQNSSDYPTPELIRRHAGLSLEDRADVAWGIVRKAIQRYGGYRGVDFDDKLINVAIRNMGGWGQLCRSDPNQMVWRHREFTRQYGVACRTGRGDPRPLPGIATDSKNPAYETVRCNLPEHPIVEKLLGHTPSDEARQLAITFSKDSE
mgnify:CR=1 FL=1